ncbi:prepilin-type N-terminal cleavage/methylation domain-containing protein [Halobacteroides halobius DSM 5150]|uniref:Prepilin-type N-terminal cleavage/methylation domain-containing protein n=1 Tax=Halobacteroides halobius (strain ATCC 35273 / DSM 5150 / MD-1) TaxID=748449 RepID=L0K8V9_HALHC|nr:prepilin-type N-terminal cleavage/methylation domain-containing protein [Halobacteroides halobius]AGB41722.1 prepilin-type N-terminal cleavage/methylation domain-containing protein [Halobacteroides halobius DSM 5150]
MLLKQEEGMTLVEVMVGLVILSSALLPIMGFLVKQTKVIQQVKYRTKALHLGQQAIEGLKATKFSNLELKATQYTGIISQGIKFKRKVIILPYQGERDIKKIKVKILWENKQSLELVTLLSRR